MSRWLSLLGLLFWTTNTMGAFLPRTAQECAEALGDPAGMPAALRPLLVPDTDFGLIPLPQPGDWLAAHAEPGQSFAQFVAAKPHRPDASRRTIYLLPLGDLGLVSRADLEMLRGYAAIFFQMEVRILPAYRPETFEFEPRLNDQTKQVQVLTRSILGFLRERLPEDAFCLLGVTMQDLYPAPSWNFVFGQASLRDRVGVYSFARYDPDFFGLPGGDGDRARLLRRGAKVLVHETAHMFGLRHCIYYDCALNGVNHLAEADARTMHLCPVCLRKLHHSIEFDPVRRYADLVRFYRRQQWEAEAVWCEQQVAKTAPSAVPAEKR